LFSSERRPFERSLAASIYELHKSGKEVIVMQDVPSFDFDPLLRVRAMGIPARRYLANLLRMQVTDDLGFAFPANSAVSTLTDNKLRGVVDASPGSTFVELKPMLCNDQNLCAYRDGSKALYYDSQHLTDDGAQYALRSFRFPPYTNQAADFEATPFYLSPDLPLAPVTRSTRFLRVSTLHIFPRGNEC
jgi:hypothetical protein